MMKHLENSPQPRGSLIPQSLLRQLDRFLDHKSFMPSCDIEESDHEYLLVFDIPGMNKDDIKIELHDHNILTVSGERVEEKEAGDRKARYQCERYYGTFERSFSLPVLVTPEQITATYKNGVLKVSVPKLLGQKSAQIKINDPGLTSSVGAREVTSAHENATSTINDANPSA